jgi:hypothetical protein
MRILTRMRTVLLLGCAVACACATSLAPVEADVAVEHIDGPIVLHHDESRPDWLLVTRVVDALTGKPLIGARLHQVHERNQPEGGVFFSDGTWPTDGQGFARVPIRGISGGRGWFFVDHEGYGPVAMMGYVASVVHLMPGVDLPVRVLDPFDRPIANAALGLCLGCGHTPDVRTATTDRNGYALLRCLEPTSQVTEESDIRDVYVRAPGFGGPYEEAKWRLGDPPAVLRPEFMSVVRGRVVAPSGSPVAGVAIGGGLHRGPWAWSAADGSFSHVGRESRGDQLRVLAFDRDYSLRPPAADRALVVVLPTAKLGERPQGRIRVTVRDAATNAPVAGAFVDAWLPGLVHPNDPTASEVTGADGTCMVVAPAGSADVQVSDSVAVPSFDPEVMTVEVPSTGACDVAVRVTARALRTVTVAGDWRSLSLITAHGATSIEELVRDAQPVPLPTRAGFALAIDPDSQTGRRFVFASLPAEPIALRPFAPTCVTVRIVDQRGRPVAARVDLLEQTSQAEDDERRVTTDEDGVASIATTLVGCAFLRVEPTADNLRARTVHLSLPPLGDDIRHDVGTVLARSTTSCQFRVLHANGTPAQGTVRLMRPGLVVDEKLAPDGGFDGIDLTRGDRLTLISGGRRPLSMTWTGQATWELPAHDAAIRFEVVDDLGLQPTELVALFGDRIEHERDGGLVLAELPAGDVEIFVGARRCHSARVTTRLRAGEQRNIRIVLRRE